MMLAMSSRLLVPEPFLHVPLAEPQVPADPVPPKPPLPPAAVDRLLRHAQVGSQLIDRQEPVRAAHGSRNGGPVPDRCTLASPDIVKCARPLSPALHGNHRRPRLTDDGARRKAPLELTVLAGFTALPATRPLMPLRVPDW